MSSTVLDRTSGARRIALVAGGGLVGTLARYGVGAALGGARDWPVATLLVNVSGAFVLGVLLDRLHGRESPDVRLLVVTGFLGSFTTYSALAVEAERMLSTGSVVASAVYLGGSLTAGLAACTAGVFAASAVARRRLADDSEGDGPR